MRDQTAVKHTKLYIRATDKSEAAKRAHSAGSDRYAYAAYLFWQKVADHHLYQAIEADRAAEAEAAKPVLHVNYSLRRVKLNRQGYEANGSYWGIGQPLYVCDFRADEERSIETGYLRANSRQEAIAQAKMHIALFYRTAADKVCLWRGNV
jgi:hypothetical protein